MITYRGTIENGRLVLDGGAKLPNGAEVDVQLRRTTKKSKKKASRRAAKSVDPIYRIAELAVDDKGPRDLAHQHDHYIYGTPKKRTRKRRA